jgi:hypothetical protein
VPHSSFPDLKAHIGVPICLVAVKPFIETRVARFLSLGLALAVVLAAAVGARANRHSSADQAAQTMNCVYSALSERVLAKFDAVTGGRSDCVVVFANTMSSWADWERPWFLNHQRDSDWAGWATAAGQRRTLVITLSMFPPGLHQSHWRRAGAEGRFDAHARALAQNLVAAGLGASVIRLGAEMNGDWNADNVGTTPSEFRLWVRAWRHEVLAMKSVPGAAFRFDWNVNAAVRPIPLARIYPGNDVVDIVGVDAYDQGVPGRHDRWSTIYRRPLGIADVLRFARGHGKPLSIPEWGLSPAKLGLGGGDDPSYVRGIASVVAHNRVAYQAYFYKGAFAAELDSGRASLRAYRRYFAR